MPSQIRANCAHCVTPGDAPSGRIQGVPTKYARINIVRNPGLEARLAGLSAYAKTHEIRRESELVRAMIDAGYDELRRRELREAMELNAHVSDDDVGEAALRTLAEDGLIDA